MNFEGIGYIILLPIHVQASHIDLMLALKPINELDFETG